jgi:hypothetical protein
LDIIDLFVDFMILIFAAVIGFAVFYATNTSGWNATVVIVWNLVPLAFIGLGMIALIIKIKYMKS